MAERQAQHRQAIEAQESARTDMLASSLMAIEFRNSLTGLIFAFVIGLVTVGGGISCVLFDKQGYGAFISALGLAAIVSTFVYGSRTRRGSRLFEDEDSDREAIPDSR